MKPISITAAACAALVSLLGCRTEPHDIALLLEPPGAGPALPVGDPATIVSEATLAGASNEPVLDLDTGTPTAGEARDREGGP
jgi:hypothetical protein